MKNAAGVTWQTIQDSIFWYKIYSKLLSILLVNFLQALIWKHIVVIIFTTFYFHLDKNPKSL